MPREHRPTANNLAGLPAGPYGPRDTLFSSQKPSFPNTATPNAVVDLTPSTPARDPVILDLGTPKFGETTPMKSRIAGGGIDGGVGGGGGSMLIGAGMGMLNPRLCFNLKVVMGLVC